MGCDKRLFGGKVEATVVSPGGMICKNGVILSWIPPPKCTEDQIANGATHLCRTNEDIYFNTFLFPVRIVALQNQNFDSFLLQARAAQAPDGNATLVGSFLSPRSRAHHAASGPSRVQSRQLSPLPLPGLSIRKLSSMRSLPFQFLN